jgi:hypothetical protein
MNITESHEYIDGRYVIAMFSGIEIGPTGLLVISRLTLNKTEEVGLPEFLFRWDEKSNELDIEPEDTSRSKANLFKRGTARYHGHHTTKIGSGPRVFEADIWWEGKQIYKGQIGFSLARDVAAFVSVGVKAEATVSVKEAAHKLQLSQQHVHYLLAKGKLLGKRLGRDWAVFGLNYERKRRPKGVKDET